MTLPLESKLAILELWQTRVQGYISALSPLPESDIKILNDLCELAGLSMKKFSDPTSQIIDKIHKRRLQLAEKDPKNTE